MFDLVCGTCAVGSRVARGLAVYGGAAEVPNAS